MTATAETTGLMRRAEDVLRARFGHAGFRAGQREAVAAVLDGRDALVVLPTGGGKSVCFQIPALLRDGLTVVISPLISLMKDQVDALAARGVPAAFVNSTLTAAEVADRFAQVRDGTLKLLYVAPERFELGRTAERLRDAGVSLLAVDEAHCISEWGHDFRPSYRRVRAIREALGVPQTVALTATATPAVRRDIEEQLGLREPEIVVSGFDRANLRWHVLPTKNDAQKDATLCALLDRVPGPAIVYASTRKAVDRVAQMLDRAGVAARAYHAGLDDSERHEVQDAFLSERTRAIVATNAFGMGIDKPNVRLVVHYAMPGSLEAYYQEAGRAGRDEAPSECVLLHAFPDRFTHEFFIKGSFPDDDVVRATYEALCRAASPAGVVALPLSALAGRLPGKVSDKEVESALRMLRAAGAVHEPAGARSALVTLRWPTARIAAHFGDTQSAAREVLRACWKVAGTRLSAGALVDLDTVAGMLEPGTDLVAALDTLAADGMLQWALAGEGVHLADRRRSLDAFPIDWSHLAQRRRVANEQLDVMQRYAYADRCRRAFVLSYFGDPAGRNRRGSCGSCDVCLAGERPFEVVEPRATTRARPARPARPARSASTPTTASDDPDLVAAAAARFDALREWRASEARAAQVPAFVVFPDRTLRAIAEAAPKRLADLSHIPGVGPSKLDRYGESVLHVLWPSTRIPD
ncbi:MAG: ATP-dependent DNA helicase RecQ [Gemmatimonadaceae bacterium]|nr:ATP-dependent DNA helicase RecQ [Gemmatimonadaceae bacterium]